MCGRYASSRKKQELIDEFEVLRDRSEAPDEPDYNVAPTKPVPAVMIREDKESGDLGRELRSVRWGLVPSWAKDIRIGNKMINARFETVHEKPAYRRAFARRRCLLPADGYYEWYKPEDGGGPKAPKQPFFIRPEDGGVMAMAGLYELWKDAEGQWLWTCTIITTTAPDELGRIHDRMPMIVEPESWAAWLDPRRTAPDDVRALLVPAMAGQFEAYPVSTEVNNVRNNGPELMAPLTD